VAEIFQALAAEGTWASLREQGIPAEPLIGFIEARVGDDAWFLSKGHALFGLPELAYQGPSAVQGVRIESIFYNLFYYMYQIGPVLRPGHTMERADLLLRCSAPAAGQNVLDSPYGTLVLAVEAKE
jgi:hypothetical protein